MRWWTAASGAAFLLIPFAAQLFLYAARWYETANRANTPRISWPRAMFADRGAPLRAFAREYFFSIMYILTMAAGGFARLFGTGRDPHGLARIKRGEPVIILIHGYMSRPWMFWLMRLRLLKSVPNAVTFGYRPAGGDIADYTAKLRDFILKIRSGTGARRIVLLGHSFGGIIAHDYAREYEGDGDIKAVIAMGSPFRGSRLSAFSVTPLGRALHPSNPELGRIIGARIGAPFLSIYSRYDQFVLPYTNCEHPLADSNVEIRSCGHSGFYFDRNAFRIAAGWIKHTIAGESGEP